MVITMDFDPGMTTVCAGACVLGACCCTGAVDGVFGAGVTGKAIADFEPTIKRSDPV
jgi:hypothetical protein